MRSLGAPSPSLGPPCGLACVRRCAGLTPCNRETKTSHRVQQHRRGAWDSPNISRIKKAARAVVHPQGIAGAPRNNRLLSFTTTSPTSRSERGTWTRSARESWASHSATRRSNRNKSESKRPVSLLPDESLIKPCLLSCHHRRRPPRFFYPDPSGIEQIPGFAAIMNHSETDQATKQG